MNTTTKKPSPFVSLATILLLVVLLAVTIRIFGSSSLEGGSQMVLLTTTAICVAISMGFYHVKWKAIEDAIVKNISGVGVSLLILLLIGALSGSWMISGIVPTLIYYGIDIIHPNFYLASTCIICCVVSVMTGSSWTTIATIGIALMGVGQAQGFSDGWIAGAIISGAYFGDKISPLSDTTVLASSITDTPLFTHIRYMMKTTIPSIILTLIIFTVAGFMHQSTGAEQLGLYTDTLKETFHISLWLLVVPVLTGIMIARKFPSLVTLFLSALLAGIAAIIFQPHLLEQIAGGVVGASGMFKGLLIAFYGSTQIDTGDATLNDLVSTGGMAGMLNTVWLILCAMCFGGAMTASGMLQSIISLFIRFMRKTVGMVASTVVSGIFFNLTTSDQYISIILTGNLFRHIYKERGYESRLLSRTIEDGVTVTSPLIPWNTCGMTQSAILGISTFTYFPYCFFNIISPLMSIAIAAIGYKIVRTKE
ncbi:MAG: Na+/H+ antiporter NhaC [Mediterranea sp.]|nr:Na+/H+ antiporter NhaC [Mediterranea sp.]